MKSGPVCSRLVTGSSILVIRSSYIDPPASSARAKTGIQAPGVYPHSDDPLASIRSVVMIPLASRPA